MHFNEILTQERKKRGLSQEELASRIQVSRQAVSKWETGDAMPDLNKLLALADALDLSLDALCGRESPSAAVPGGEGSAPPASEPAASVPGRSARRPKMRAFLCALLVGVLTAAGLWVWTQRDAAAVTEIPLSALPDAFSVSGVEFHGKTNYRVGYQFTPSVSGEHYTYEITFTDAFGRAHTFDAPCSGGVCSGVAVFDSNTGGYSVTVCVSDSLESRNVAVAAGLSFSEGQANWTPLKE